MSSRSTTALGTARTAERAAYVLRRSGSAETIGFYTLASYSILLKDLPADVAKKLPRYPLLPATLIGRMAVSSAYKRRGLGQKLLIDALDRSLEASESVASAAVVVDAKDEISAGFYAHHDFQPFPTNPLRLFITMNTVRAALES